MISVTHSGSFKNLENFLEKNEKLDIDRYLDMYGQKGVEALSEATPRDTGKTAASWGYKIIKSKNKTTIIWTNDNVVDDWYNVALMIQYGHGTGSGVYVEGVDYINPAIRSIFDKMAEEIWKEVTLV
jgi:hypothetical protein